MGEGQTSLSQDPGRIDQLHALIRSGVLDPLTLLERCLERIEAVETKVQGWLVLDTEGARAEAARRGREARDGRIRSVLHGVPVSLKDLIDVAGWQTRAGSPTRAAIAPAETDAEIVTRLRVAGAVILGKSHTTEFAYFSGPPPTRNPHDLARTPGGSSSGPAAVVASGMVPFSLGTQTAGSVCRPAAFCGIAAFKPTGQAMPSIGMVPFAPAFDTIGIFGYRMIDALSAIEPLMPPALSGPRPVAPARLKLALISDALLDEASAPALDCLERAAVQLSAASHRIESRAPPTPFKSLSAWHRQILEYELGRLHRGLLAAEPGQVSEALREGITRGLAISARAHWETLGVLGLASRAFWSAFADYDGILFPAALGEAPEGMATGDPRMITPFTALGGPIATIPAGLGPTGMPLGLMLAGPPGRDGALGAAALKVAEIIELPR